MDLGCTKPLGGLNVPGQVQPVPRPTMSIGSLMLDLEGLEPTPDELELLRHPVVGGVILFTRNYQSPEQLAALTDAIHRQQDPPLLVAVDQEGGRVQRFRDGFARLPAAAWYGQLLEHHPRRGRQVCERAGWLMAAELRSLGVDFSFAPVLDLGGETSEVIGDRAFAPTPHWVADLARHWMQGVHQAGMAAVGKHFPGHGRVRADSHTELPEDPRSLRQLLEEDLVPFARLIDAGLEAMMPAHVRYPQVDPRPAGFSSRWLKDILRERLGFQGAIFSDDLSMGAAQEAGDYLARAQDALAAGCDMVLVCNNRPGALAVVDGLAQYQNPASELRLLRMHGRHPINRDDLHQDARWQEALHLLARWEQDPSLWLPLDS